jgi:hypothetical protein
MTRILIAALVVSAPALALPPGPCKGAQSVLCRKVTPTRADMTFTITECTDKKLGTEATAWRPGLTDKSVPEHSWKVSQDHSAAVGAGHTYHAKGFKLSVNWTTSPDPRGGHIGQITATVGSQKIDEKVLCNLQGGHLEPRKAHAPKADAPKADAPKADAPKTDAQ